MDAGYREKDRRRTGGYVALYRLDGETVAVLLGRHQRKRASVAADGGNDSIEARSERALRPEQFVIPLKQMLSAAVGLDDPARYGVRFYRQAIGLLVLRGRVARLDLTDDPGTA